MQINEHFEIRQYYGPNIKCGFAAIEIGFVGPQSLINWADVLMLLKSIGHDAAPIEGNGKLEFSLALGRLAAVLQSEPDKKWKAGRIDNNAWVCLAYRNVLVTRNALVLAFRTLLNLKSNNLGLLKALKQQLHYSNASLPVLMMLMLEAEAEERGIPLYDVSKQAQTRQFGQGKFGWHFVFASQQSDSLTGYQVSKNKAASSELLSRLGYPHSVHLKVRDKDQVGEALEKLGFPCVIKPIDGGHGAGITVGVNTIEEACMAFVTAKKCTDGLVLVEKQVEGQDHRMAVFRGKLQWVYRRTPPHVIGDGAATLGDLIHSENALRSKSKKNLEMGLKPITIDDELLSFVQKQEFSLATVVPAGKHVYLRGQANISQGGTLDDVTAHVHPDNLDMAEQVARAFRLGSMGLDFMTADISRSWREGQCAIIEVNGLPGMSGVRDAHMVVKAQFPFPQDGRVPSCLVVGEQSDANALALIRLLVGKGLVVGRSLSQETAVGGNVLSGVLNKSLSVRAEALVLHSDTQAIVISTTEEEILTYGLPLDRFSVIICQSGAGVVDPNLAKLFDAQCHYWICRDEFPEETLAEIVASSMGEHQNNLNTVSDHIVVRDGPSVALHAHCPYITTKIRVWRVPCIPLDIIKQEVSELLKTTFDSNSDTYLLTQDMVVSLIVTWTHTLLRTTGHSIAENVPFAPKHEKYSLQSRRREYQLSITYDQLEAVRVAQTWSVATLNHFINTFTCSHSLEGCGKALTAVTDKTLMDLKKLAP